VQSERATRDARPTAPPLAEGQAEAIFAGGCFWCMEKPFETVPGVVSVTSGFTGGDVPGATYDEVSRGGTGHFEAVRVVYDPTRVSYAALLEVFFHNVDPTQGDGQFCDRGDQYRSAIFVHDARERDEARAALKRAHATLHAPVVTQILDVVPFYVAEDYHQDFYRTHPERYTSYRLGCGRDARLRALWDESASH
jgi:peptide-methionine (S)-S-oxide reductase